MMKARHAAKATNRARRLRMRGMGASLLCLFALGLPLSSHAATFVSSSTGGISPVIQNNGSHAATVNFGNSDDLQTSTWSHLTADDEGFQYFINMNSAPSLQFPTSGYDETTGVGILDLHWDGIASPENGPSRDQWENASSQLVKFGAGSSASVTVLDLQTGADSYWIRLGINNAGSSSTMTIAYDGGLINPGPWEDFKPPAGGTFTFSADPGNPSTVPIPPAVGLFGSALFALAAIRRRKRDC